MNPTGRIAADKNLPDDNRSFHSLSKEIETVDQKAARATSLLGIPKSFGRFESRILRTSDMKRSQVVWVRREGIMEQTALRDTRIHRLKTNGCNRSKQRPDKPLPW
jgi:hypothetical protein